MKKLISILGGLVLTLALVTVVSAAKPADNHAGAVTYGWHLSGAVMPVPPYGSLDIPGSDTASKLIVNQPNGKVTTNVTGVMKGLNPDTTYTVYLSNGYTPYTPQSVVGTWTWTVLGTYVHDIIITTQNPDGTFSGTGGWPSGGLYQTTETITGQIVGNTVTFTTTYLGPYNPGYTVTVTGTINPGGSISGNSPWAWNTSAGAVKPALGSTGWPGLLTGVSTFTFTTNSGGEGSWHYNFKDTVLKEFSVWINGAGATILISDSILF
ncbi:hypothetical protein MUP46_00580 [Patescibacteria group bacterium]|nr:hypothetical protein [Patescibacteria group bacterium]